MIQDYDNLIKTLNDKCKLIIGDDFRLKLCNGDGHSFTIYNNIGHVKAVNRLDGGIASEVYVYNWFGCYYLYVEVKFIFTSKKPHGKRTPRFVLSQCSISISVFKQLDEKIVQLFRAEWDDYDDNNSLHPQPHWHITSDTSVANTFNEYAKEFGEDGFMNILNSEKEHISSLKKFHFAMKEKWEEDMTHSTPMESSVQISKWFAGLLNSIRAELQYIDDK